jgi:di- and tripeptidase
LTPIYVLTPYLETGAGDLFSLAWSSLLQTVYVGCQNTSLQWFDFSNNLGVSSPDFYPCSATSTPGGQSRKAHKFFDSYPQFERRPADINAMNGVLTPSTIDLDGCVQHASAPSPRGFLQVPASNVIDSAHYGYVYCMTLLPSTGEVSDDPSLPVDRPTQLVTGSGDETVKVTSIQQYYILN